MTAGRSINSISQHWCTPLKYVRAVRGVFGGTIALDPCSNPHSVVAAEAEYQLPNDDGLRLSWDYPTIYVNPPYGADRRVARPSRTGFAAAPTLGTNTARKYWPSCP